MWGTQRLRQNKCGKMVPFMSLGEMFTDSILLLFQLTVVLKLFKVKVERGKHESVQCPRPQKGAQGAANGLGWAHRVCSLGFVFVFGISVPEGGKRARGGSLLPGREHATQRSRHVRREPGSVVFQVQPRFPRDFRRRELPGCPFPLRELWESPLFPVVTSQSRSPD